MDYTSAGVPWTGCSWYSRKPGDYLYNCVRDYYDSQPCKNAAHAESLFTTTDQQ